MHVVGAGPAGVYNKTGVLFRYLRASHAEALQPRLVDQRRGKLPLGPLEGTAGGGQVERLLIPPALIKVPHFGGDLLPVTRFQAQHGAENHTAGELFKKTAPIAEVAFVSRNLVQPLLRQIIADNALNRIFQLPAVGPGVHNASAAQRAGNTGGKFQALKAVLLGKAGKLRQRDTRLGVDGPVGQEEHFRKPLGADYKKRRQTLVGKEDIGAVSKQQGGNMIFLENTAYF